MFGEFDISEVGFEDMAVGHVPVEDGAQQEEGIHKVEGFSQGVVRMCEGERHEDDEQEDGGAYACPFRFGGADKNGLHPKRQVEQGKQPVWVHSAVPILCVWQQVGIVHLRDDEAAKPHTCEVGGDEYRTVGQQGEWDGIEPTEQKLLEGRHGEGKRTGSLGRSLQCPLCPAGCADKEDDKNREKQGTHGSPASVHALGEVGRYGFPFFRALGTDVMAEGIGAECAAYRVEAGKHGEDGVNHYGLQSQCFLSFRPVPTAQGDEAFPVEKL